MCKYKYSCDIIHSHDEFCMSQTTFRGSQKLIWHHCYTIHANLFWTTAKTKLGWLWKIGKSINICMTFCKFSGLPNIKMCHSLYWTYFLIKDQGKFKFSWYVHLKECSRIFFADCRISKACHLVIKVFFHSECKSASFSFSRSCCARPKRNRSWLRIRKISWRSVGSLSSFLLIMFIKRG